MCCRSDHVETGHTFHLRIRRLLARADINYREPLARLVEPQHKLVKGISRSPEVATYSACARKRVHQPVLVEEDIRPQVARHGRIGQEMVLHGLCEKLRREPAAVSSLPDYLWGEDRAIAVDEADYALLSLLGSLGGREQTVHICVVRMGRIG